MVPVPVKGLVRCRPIVVAALSLLGAACEQAPPMGQAPSIAVAGDEPPEYAYIPEPDVVVDVRISAAAAANVGEWIDLSATRRTTGTWRKVRAGDLLRDAVRMTAPASGFEEEVAANLRWFTDPLDAGEYDLRDATTISLRKRKVRFKAPGTYRLWAETRTPIPGTSNVLVVTIKKERTP